MKHPFSPVFCLFFILIELCIWKTIRGDRTSINGLVLFEKNQSTPSLMNNNLVLIIKNDTNQNDIHNLQLKIDQDSFPIRFNFENIDYIKKDGTYLLGLLVFGFTHRLLWEGIIFRQNLFVNHVNNITFIVRDVSNLPKCLSPGYPCLEGYDIPNQFISVCCSNTKCQPSKTKQMTCGGGNISAIHNVTIIYNLPRRISPTIGRINNNLVQEIETTYQSISEACAVIKIIDAIISTESTNQGVYHNWFVSLQFILQFHVLITTTELDDECLTKTLRSIQTHSLPLQLPLQDGPSIIVLIQNPIVNVTDLVETATTLKGHWVATGNMTSSRSWHAATVLPNGTVLVAGGLGSEEFLSSTELYDPLTGSWTPAANLTFGRYWHTATTLLNGTVLVVGGMGSLESLFSAELYDPVTSKWTLTGNMTYLRFFHSATLLLNGTVLVTGGTEIGKFVLSAELYNPVTEKWALTSNITYLRYFHSATLLPTGKVLVVGGIVLNGSEFSAELYDPVTDKWTLTGNTTYPRYSHSATLLLNGKVLVVGGKGLNGSEFSAELYDPVTGKWALTGNMTYSRYGHSATLLPSGTVLVVGGDELDESQSSPELYDPVTGRWMLTNNMTYPRNCHTAVILRNGTVLVAGGIHEDDPLFNSELYYM